MNDADFSSLTSAVSPAAGNGTHGANRKNKPKPGRSVDSGVQTAPQPMEASFITGGIEPIDAPMWLIHAALWLQSEQAPSIPAWTGLAIERHNRIPAPDFLRADNAPPNRHAALDGMSDVLRPAGHGAFPQSDLTPLGWDPRTICRKQGYQ